MSRRPDPRPLARAIESRAGAVVSAIGALEAAYLAGVRAGGSDEAHAATAFAAAYAGAAAHSVLLRDLYRARSPEALVIPHGGRGVLHGCGGGIAWGNPGRFCDRCRAFTHAEDDDDLPTGVDLAANREAYDLGDARSPDATDD